MKVNLPLVTRSAQITCAQRAADDDETSADDRAFRITLSSETEVERMSFDGRMIEVLDHSNGSVRMDWLQSGRAPLLADHDRSIQIGVIDSAVLNSDRKIEVSGRFGKSDQAEAELRDVRDGIRTNVSVGYRIHRAVLEEDTADRQVYRVTDWEPFEASIVSIPADMSNALGVRTFDAQVSMIETKDPPMKDENKSADDTRVELSDAEVRKIREDKSTAEKNRVDEIVAYGRRFGQQKFADEHVQAGTSVELFRGLMLDRIPNETPLDTPPSQLDMEPREAKRFSFLRAMRLLDAQRSGADTTKLRADAAFEIECSRAISDRAGAGPKGMFIPLDVRNRVYDMAPNDAKRDLSVGTDSAGGYLRGTDHLGSSFIEALRNAIVVRSLGARVLTGLVGNVAIPSRTSGSTAAWLATEAANAAESDSVFAQVTLTPNTVAAYTDVNRQLMLQSDPSIEALIRDDLAYAAANAIDLGALNGSGASGQPEGILNVSGIGDVNMGANGAAPTWATIVEFAGDLMAANAYQGSLGWAVNGATWAKLMSTVKDSGSGQFLMAENGTSMLGHPVAPTNNLPSDLTKGSGTALSAMIFGNWNDLLIGEWGQLDLVIDPYTNSLAGTIRFVIHQTVDVAVRHAASFSASNEVVTA